MIVAGLAGQGASPSAMAGAGDIAYVAARVQARLAGWPGEVEWSRLNPIDALNHYLDNARQGPLAGWLTEVQAKQDVHTLQAQLRVQLLARLTELQHWSPAELQAALRWCQWLPYLEPLASLLDGQPSQSWMYHDPVLHDLLDEQGQLLSDRLPSRAPANLLPPAGHGSTLMMLWQSSLFNLVGEDIRETLRRGPLARAMTAIGSAHPLFNLTESGQALAVEGELRRFIHVDPARPSLLLAYALMLYWLFLRLRSELVMRRLFAARVGV